ncbi:MbnP family protein [Rapidithrix thailandica]|uniref:MbnP family protein n=1 Tax=Rapidithrix thailandica TaxID=413964 RepID=A0AAW9S0Z6_9BACT
MKAFISLLLISLLIVSCGKDDPQVTPKGEVKFIFDFLMNGEPLELNTKNYTNANGDIFQVNEFKFYLSNLKLKANEALFEEAESYHLINRGADSNQFSFTVKNVPKENYTHLEFGIGVDPTKNHSLDNTGDLDPSNNMAWDWNTGYKFVLLEGKFFPPDSEARGLIYHIGTDENYKEVTLALQHSSQNAPLFSEASTSATVRIEVELSQMFEAPNVMNFADNNVVMMGEVSQKVVENYTQGMLKVVSVEVR